MLHPLRLLLIVFIATASATSTAPIARAQSKPAPKAPVVPEQLDAGIQSHQSGVRMTLLAEHPALVTPTGIDVDKQGNIWLIACHTHFRPEGYDGPEHDEVLVFNREGGQRRVFYNKTDATMQVKVGDDGWVYLAERDRVLRVKDSDNDGVGDVEENLAVLDTVADYPHNGLSGMAWHPSGGLVFSLGENFGKDWTLTGRDKSQVSGRGEGGVFWMRADGQQMRRMARGFWNPFGLMVRADGEIFAAENDPGSRPPCRLLQIVEGADYGYQWVYGSAPIHPFVAWNGELRGTLGMIHPCGEGPSAIVQLGGGVLIPSWSNHAIEYFPLRRQGAGYKSERVDVITGSEAFRPVGMAVGPTGDFFVTDWVFSSYELHKRGRLWKLEIDRSSKWFPAQSEPMNVAAETALQLREGKSKPDLKALFDLARGQDPYLADAALTAIARASSAWTPETLRKMPSPDRLWALVALRRTDLKEEKWVRALWDDQDPAIRFEVLRWIADGVLTSFTSDVEKLLHSPDTDYDLFEASLAAWNTLRGNPGAGVTDPDVLAERLLDPATPSKIKSYALRLAPANHKKIDAALLQKLYDSGERDLQTEVIRTLGAKNSDEARDMLLTAALAKELPVDMRADAIAGLGPNTAAQQVAVNQALLKLAEEPDTSLRHEALRSLRSTALDEAARGQLKSIGERFPVSAEHVQAILAPASWKAGRPNSSDTAAWLKRLDALPGSADANAGRRLFHRAAIGQCANCHRHSGRGNVVGPDLSLAARQGDRASLLRSILEPNRDVAPQYFATALELEDGKVFTGILLRSSNVDVYRDATGNERVFKKTDVTMRKELKTSLMPTGLVDQMTDQDLRDLLSFLAMPYGVR